MTGVQTCALPICLPFGPGQLGRRVSGSPKGEAEIFRGELGDPVPGAPRSHHEPPFLFHGEGTEPGLYLSGVAAVDLEKVAEVAEGDLEGHGFRYRIDLGQFVNPLFLIPPLFPHILGAEIDPLAPVVILVDLDDVEVEGDGELGVGSGA